MFNPAEDGFEIGAGRRAKPRVLLSHPTGNQNVRNALMSLAEREMLTEFWTTLAWSPKSFWGRMLPGGVRAQLSRRAFPESRSEQIRTVPWREIVRLGTRSTRLEKLICSLERPFSVIGVYRHFDRRVAKRLQKLKPDIIYAYEGGALRTFREAKRLGLTLCYELPSAYWHWEHQLMLEEAERNPEFAGLLPKLLDSPTHMQWKDEELALADYVFVPSQHVRKTLRGVVPDEKIRVVNYGAPLLPSAKRVSPEATRSLKVLFVGSLIQRKGISYLLQAVEMLGRKVELTLVGRRFRPNPKVDRACHRWRWYETLPHWQVADLMLESDVLVLPSLTEAFGLVVTEALASGLPVIVTPNTGASEIIHNGQEGFIVPVGRADAIAESLNKLYEDRELLEQMSRQAQKTAAEMSWEGYRARWTEAVRNLSWR